MKFKLLTMAALCAIAFQANAQTEKGKSLIGGSIQFTSTTTEQGTSASKQTDLSAGPKYGYFLGKNLAIGVSLNYYHSRGTSSYEKITAANGGYNTTIISQTTKQDNTNFGPFVRYYVDITEKFKFFGEFNANIGFGKNETSDNYPSGNKFTTYNANIIPSVAFFPTKKLAVELGISLISYTNIENELKSLNYLEAKAEVFQFGFNSMNPTLGVNFHF